MFVVDVMYICLFVCVCVVAERGGCWLLLVCDFFFQFNKQRPTTLRAYTVILIVILCLSLHSENGIAT
jgi:hypothetical protein